MERPDSQSNQSTEGDSTPRDGLNQSGWPLSKSTDDLFRHFMTMSGDSLRASTNSFLLNASSGGTFPGAPFQVETSLTAPLGPSPMMSPMSGTSIVPPTPSATVQFDPRTASAMLNIVAKEEPNSDKSTPVPVQLPPNINPEVDPEPDWESWSSDQKREWLRLHDVKGTWEKNLSQKCSDVWLKVQQRIPLHASTKPARSAAPPPADPSKWFASPDFPDEPVWPTLADEKKRAFLKKHDIRGIWAKHLDLKCSEIWRKTHQPAHETGHLTRKAAAARALAAAAAAAHSAEHERMAVVPREPPAIMTLETSRGDVPPPPTPAIVTDDDKLANFPRRQIPALIQLARANNIGEITSLLNTTFSQVIEADRQKRTREESALSLNADELALLGPAAKRVKLAEENLVRQIQEKNDTIEILTSEVARLREENAALQEKCNQLTSKFGSVTDMFKSIAQTSTGAGNPNV